MQESIDPHARTAKPGEPEAHRTGSVSAQGVTDEADLFEVARRALVSYRFTPASELALLEVSENATFKVTDPADDRTMVLRVHRLGYHTHAEVLSELDWLDALTKQAGVRTPAVIRTDSGARVVPVDAGEPEPRLCVGFEFLPGAQPGEDRLVENFNTLGSITAQMHRHVMEWHRPPGFVRFAWDLDAAFSQDARWGDWRSGVGVGASERAVLQPLQETLTRRLTAYGMARNRYGLIHADLRLANLLVDGAHIAVIDFDDCGWGWYLYDLAAALSFIEHEPVVPDLIDSWLRGYRTVREISPEDEAEIWTFVLFRRLLLTAWIGSHPAVEFARNLGAGFAAGTCALAEHYLSKYA